jgi:hypothetical protein
MKKLYLAIFAIVTISMPVAVVATPNTVTLYQGSYSYDVGGEFTAVTSSSFLGNGYVAGETEETANGATGFQTFCIETTVDFNPGHSYYYSLSSNDSNGNALSLGAAYLYYEFATGNLTGYNYLNNNISMSNPSRLNDAGLLQAAIWWFQGNQTYSGYYGSSGHPSISSDPYYTLAVNALGGYNNAISANNGFYSVDVLQMWANSNDTGAAQNQLVLVPDGGVTAMLLGSALAGLGMLRRKLNR